MRISDWSSDVCSSDLRRDSSAAPLPDRRQGRALRGGWCAGTRERGRSSGSPVNNDVQDAPSPDRELRRCGDGGPMRCGRRADTRSEEHTSELQSLMRISYAVFSLKKKKKKTKS